MSSSDSSMLLDDEDSCFLRINFLTGFLIIFSDEILFHNLEYIKKCFTQANNLNNNKIIII